jgi:glycosyltransferase involved in cell wall biosynthesis
LNQTELIVLSHLRWDWVWQRPQQLISRLGAVPGRKTWFVEEPVQRPGITENRLVTQEVDGLTRVWLEIPEQGHHVGYFPEVLPDYIEQLPALLGTAAAERIVWIYTPLALDAAVALDPTTLVYDVMDDLAAFKDAAPELVLRQRQALQRADVVFAGGRSLHRSVVRQGREDAVLLPSGVSTDHYSSAVRVPREPGQRPAAGYVGVIDERLDLGLIAGLADALPEWDIRMIGPVTKIDPADLPQRANIHYLGQQEYKDLPRLMAELDVALMPFALNEATHSISPTKTLEYLAAGLAVVSTRVPDVVVDYASIVSLRDDAAGFAAACEESIVPRSSTQKAEIKRQLAAQDWDAIADRMAAHVLSRDESVPESESAAG